jgi:hypothetical protein
MAVKQTLELATGHIDRHGFTIDALSVEVDRPPIDTYELGCTTVITSAFIGDFIVLAKLWQDLSGVDVQVLPQHLVVTEG